MLYSPDMFPAIWSSFSIKARHVVFPLPGSPRKRYFLVESSLFIIFLRHALFFYILITEAKVRRPRRRESESFFMEESFLLRLMSSAVLLYCTQVIYPRIRTTDIGVSLPLLDPSCVSFFYKLNPSSLASPAGTTETTEKTEIRRKLLIARARDCSCTSSAHE